MGFSECMNFTNMQFVGPLPSKFVCCLVFESKIRWLRKGPSSLNSYQKIRILNKSILATLVVRLIPELIYLCNFGCENLGLLSRSQNLKKISNSWPSASNFKSFSRSREHFCLTAGQNNFGKKIPFLNIDYDFGPKCKAKRA